MVIIKCYTDLYVGKNTPLRNIDKITLIIKELLDSIHYSREEEYDMYEQFKSVMTISKKNGRYD